MSSQCDVFIFVYFGHVSICGAQCVLRFLNRFIFVTPYRLHLWLRCPNTCRHVLLVSKPVTERNGNIWIHVEGCWLGAVLLLRGASSKLSRELSKQWAALGEGITCQNASEASDKGERSPTIIPAQK